MQNFAQQVGGVGRDLRGLGDYGVARGEGRSNLPAKQVKRQIPRTYACSDAYGAAKGVVKALGAHVVGFAGVVQNCACIKGEVVSGPRNVYGAGQFIGLSVVAGFGGGELFEALFDAVCYTHQMLAALCSRQARPFREGPFGRSNSAGHVGSVGIGNQAVDLARCRFVVIEVATVGRCSECAVDVVFELHHRLGVRPPSTGMLIPVM